MPHDLPMLCLRTRMSCPIVMKVTKCVTRTANTDLPLLGLDEEDKTLNTHANSTKSTSAHPNKAPVTHSKYATHCSTALPPSPAILQNNNNNKNNISYLPTSANNSGPPNTKVSKQASSP